MDKRPWLDFLQWPLLGGAVFCFVGGIFIVEATADEDNRAAAAILFVLGSVLVGAWVYALGVSRYSGRSENIYIDRETNDNPPDPQSEEG